MRQKVAGRMELFFAVLLVLISVHCGCKPTANNVSDQEQANTQEVNSQEVKGEEDVSEKTSGDAIRIIASKALPDKPLRLVSMAPNVTEILFGLGLGENLVGVTRYCDFPAQALAISKIGGMLDPDFEAIVAARPDLVVGVLGGADSRIGKRLDSANIPYFFVQMDTIEQTYAGIAHIGRVAGDAEAGQEMANQLKSHLAKISDALVAARADDTPKSVLMVFDHEPVVAAGPGTFSYELIKMAGFKNATADIDNPYPVLDIEKVIALNPDILLDSKFAENNEATGGFWSQYPTLSAVKSGMIKEFSDPALLRPGPRLVEALEIIGSMDGKVVTQP